MLLHRLGLSGLFACLAGAAAAWTCQGHMVISAIAESRLSGPARARLETLLTVDQPPENVRSFLTASCWADDIRSDEDADWHYINLYWRPDGQPARNRPREQNAAWAIQRFRAQLETPGGAGDQKARALRYLIHFVGDLHQPLHAASRETDRQPEGDRGGNDFPIRPIEGWRSQPIDDLHALWDFGCGLFRSTRRPLSPGAEKGIRELARAIMRDHPYGGLPNVRNQDPMTWAREGLALARTVVYEGVEFDGSPSETYLERGRRESRKRLAYAGYRLGDMLNRILGR